MKHLASYITLVLINTDTTTFLSNANVFPTFVKALVLTVAVEVIIATFFLLIAKTPLKVLRFVIIGNLFTIPLMWLLIPLLFNPVFIFAGLLIAFVLEAFFIHRMCKEHISLRLAFLFSFVLNVSGFVIGGLILLVTLAV